MADYPIVMRQLNNTGEYDTLYPASTSDQIEGLLEETTKTAFGLSTSAVPDDIFQKLANAITLNSTYGNLAVGSTVQLNVNGTPTNFLVVHQGNPDPSMYDESCNGTWLLMQDCYENRQWNYPNGNSYKASTIHTYLNDTFLNLFDADIREVIKQVKIPYVNGTGNSPVASGVNGLSCKIFLLSGREVGFSTSDNKYFPNDGAKLSYFESGTGSSAANKRIAKLNGSATNWWLRSPVDNSTVGVFYVSFKGNYGDNASVLSDGIRPCIIMPPSSLVLPNGTDVTTIISNIFDIPDLQTQIETGAKIITGSYTGTGTYGTRNPCSITADFPIKILMILGYQVTNSRNYVNGFSFNIPVMIGQNLSNKFSSAGITVDASTISTDISYGRKSEDEKTFFWYNATSAYYQANDTGTTFDYLIIG